jgi:hypothetical protein
MTKRFFGWLVAAVAVTAPWMGSANAAIVPLSDLLNGQTIQSGDKMFSDFTYTKTGDMPSPENVNVETIQAANGDFGLRFQGGFVDQAGGDSSDALVTFNVSVANAGWLINGVTLSANPAVFNGAGLASVTETFVPTIIDDKLVVYDFGNGDDLLLDEITFAGGYAMLPVQKDVILHANDPSGTGAVTMSYFDQTFSQVPEPAGLVLVIAGLLCLGRIRRQLS